MRASTPFPTTLASVLIAVAATSLPLGANAAGAGIEINDKSSAAEVGLPTYPGATIRRDKGDDGDGLHRGTSADGDGPLEPTMGAWTVVLATAPAR